MKPELSIHQLAEIRSAILSEIDDGDPTTPADIHGSPIWSKDWQLYAANEAVANEHRLRFVDAIQSRLTATPKGNVG